MLVKVTAKSAPVWQVIVKLKCIIIKKVVATLAALDFCNMKEENWEPNEKDIFCTTYRHRGLCLFAT